MTLVTPEQIRTFQRKLYCKAKQEPDFRFYSLYDKVCRRDILEHAYHLVKANKGSPGIDGETFEGIEERKGESAYLAELMEELRCKTYKAQPVRRVYIPKPDGSKRPLGIPTIRDRIVQMSVKLVIEPIFEADFCNNSYGFRPKRSAHNALDDISGAMVRGHTKVIDADISKYFDTIPHSNLLKTVAKRVCDKEILHLIKMWLKAPVVEEDEKGRRRYTCGKRTKKGTPQGGVISPLLANIYLHLMDKLWELNDYGKKLGAHLVRYADDFVILCKGKTTLAMEKMKQILTRLDLTLNEQKTHELDAYKESFDFLGFEIRMRRSKKSGKCYPHVQPSKKSLMKLKDAVTEMTSRRLSIIPIEVLVGDMNSLVRGWVNYFHHGNCSKSLGKVRRHAEDSLRRHLWRRHKMNSMKSGFIHFPGKRLYMEYGLYKVPTTAGWTKANAIQ